MRTPRGGRRVAVAAGTAVLAAALIGSGAASASYTFVASNTASVDCKPPPLALGGATPPIGIGVPVGLAINGPSQASCQQIGGVEVSGLVLPSADPLAIPDDDDVDDREDEEDRGRAPQNTVRDSEKTELDAEKSKESETASDKELRDAEKQAAKAEKQAQRDAAAEDQDLEKQDEGKKKN